VKPKARRHRAKAGPVAAVVVTTLAGLGCSASPTGAWHRGRGAAILPPLTMPGLSPDLISALFIPALLISIIGFVESISVAQTLAAKKRQRIDPDQELIGLGAANIGAGFTGGYPVTGGFARSVVNFDAGAETPAAGAFTAVGLAIAALALTPLIFFLPKATLAATIIVAVLSLVDLDPDEDLDLREGRFRRRRGDDPADPRPRRGGGRVGGRDPVDRPASLQDVEAPRAEVGLVPGTQHFRNILRHEVETDPEVVTLRIDESLYFANARFLEDLVQDRVTRMGRSNTSS
jgi:SulP family sulfate permease